MGGIMGNIGTHANTDMLSPHFSKKEFACRCCGKCEVQPELLAALETLRLLAGKPVIVLSGYRCEDWNKKIGGAPKSQHVDGTGADVRIPGLKLQQMYDLAKQVREFREGGIGVYDGVFIHVDVRKGKSRWARKHGIYLDLNTLVDV